MKIYNRILAGFLLPLFMLETMVAIADSCDFGFPQEYEHELVDGSVDGKGKRDPDDDRIQKFALDQIHKFQVLGELTGHFAYPSPCNDLAVSQVPIYLKDCVFLI